MHLGSKSQTARYGTSQLSVRSVTDGKSTEILITSIAATEFRVKSKFQLNPFFKKQVLINGLLDLFPLFTLDARNDLTLLRGAVFAIKSLISF